MKEHTRESIDPALVMARHLEVFGMSEMIENERNNWVHIDLFGSDEQQSNSRFLIKNVLRFDETLEADSHGDIQVLTDLLNKFREYNISPVFVVRTSSQATSEQISTIQRLLQNYALTYDAEYMKGWRIELQ